MSKSKTLLRHIFKLMSFMFCLVLTISCSLKLSQDFVSSNKEIYKEQWGNYFINGYNGLASRNYQGVLALGDTQFIFDAQGIGSRPNMLPMKPFTITRAEIDSIGLSESKALKKKILLIKTNNGNEYEFMIGNADLFYSEMRIWLTKE